MQRKNERKTTRKGSSRHPQVAEVDYGELCSKKYQVKEAVKSIERLSTVAKSPIGAFLAVYVWAFMDILLTFIFPRNIIENPDEHSYLENAWFHQLKSLFIFFVSAYFITHWLAKRETNNTYHDLQKSSKKLIRKNPLQQKEELLKKLKNYQSKRLKSLWKPLGIPLPFGVYSVYQYLRYWLLVNNSVAAEEQLALEWNSHVGPISSELIQRRKNLISTYEEINQYYDSGTDGIYLLIGSIGIGVPAIMLLRLIYDYYKHYFSKKKIQSIKEHLQNYFIYKNHSWKQIENSSQFELNLDLGEQDDFRVLIAEFLSLVKPTVVAHTHKELIVDFKDVYFSNPQDLAKRLKNNVKISKYLHSKSNTILSQLNKLWPYTTYWHYIIKHDNEQTPFLQIEANIGSNERRAMIKKAFNQLPSYFQESTIRLSLYKKDIDNNLSQTINTLTQNLKDLNVEESIVAHSIQPNSNRHQPSKKSNKRKTAKRQQSQHVTQEKSKSQTYTWQVNNKKATCHIDSKGNCQTKVFPVHNNHNNTTGFFNVSDEIMYAYRHPKNSRLHLNNNQRQLVKEARDKRFVGKYGEGYKYCGNQGIFGQRGNKTSYYLKLRSSRERFVAEPIATNEQGNNLFELNRFYIDTRTH